MYSQKVIKTQITALLKQNLKTRAGGYLNSLNIYFPVEPKPPVPLAVSLNSTDTSIFACSTFAITI